MRPSGTPTAAQAKTDGSSRDPYLTATQAFFGCRAATWDTKFGDDLPAYRTAVACAGIRCGGVVVDVGCGTGRALPPLRDAVGPAGMVIALAERR